MEPRWRGLREYNGLNFPRATLSVEYLGANAGAQYSARSHQEGVPGRPRGSLFYPRGPRPGESTGGALQDHGGNPEPRRAEVSQVRDFVTMELTF
jgi:hypothetical protein